MKSILFQAHVIVLFISASFLFTQCATSSAENKFQNSELVKIAEFTDYRSTDSLLPYLTHKQPLMRVEAAYALASVRDPKAIDKLHVALEDPIAEVRAAAAYALGQTLHPSSVEPLSLQINTESNTAAYIAMAEALGKIGGALRAASAAPEWTETAANTLVNMQRADSIGVHAMAKGAFWLHNGGWDDPQLMNKMASQFHSQSSVNRRMIVYAMARYRGNWYSDTVQANRFIHLLDRDKDTLVLTIGASIAGRTKTLAASAYIKRILQSAGSDKRQLIAACRAAGNHEGVESKSLLPLIQHKSIQVAQEACTALQSKTLSAAELGQIRSEVEQMPAVLQAATARLLHMMGDTLQVALWFEKIKQTTDIYQRLMLIRALGVSGKSAEICLSAAAHQEDILEANAYAEAFIESHGQPDFPLSIDYPTSLLQLIKRNDIGITALCATELRNIQLTSEVKALLNVALLQSLKTLELPKEVETANEIIKTLNTWAISPREEIKPTFNHPIDWDLVKSIPRKQIAQIITNKGTIQIELHVEEAPGSVASFVKLCREGFYNGKSFHRVVPNFVVQGGCPRGDGMGGTNYTMRSEFRLHDYSTGSVGLASSGPDTESCQWFITHLPTPHLEGRYTIFGHVLEGMEVVDLINVGDRIERIELL